MRLKGLLSLMLLVIFVASCSALEEAPSYDATVDELVDASYTYVFRPQDELEIRYLDGGNEALFQVQDVIEIKVFQEAENSVFRARDEIEISVGQDQDYKHSLRIGHDGMIDLPFVGSLKAQNKTREEIRTEVRRRLISGGYYLDPQVTVNIINSTREDEIILYSGPIGNDGFIDLNKVGEVQAKDKTRTQLRDLVHAELVRSKQYQSPQISINTVERHESDADNIFTVRVGHDGNIDLPIAGVVFAKGCSREQLRSAIKERLVHSGRYSTPHITVNIIESHQPPNVAVIGAVNRPVAIPYHTDMNLAEALAIAGGLKEDVGFANPIFVVRNSLDRPRVFQFDMEDAINQRSRFPRLFPGDVVIAQASDYQDVERAVRLARDATNVITSPIFAARDIDTIANN